MGKNKTKNTTQVTVRIDPAWLAPLDAIAQAASLPGLDVKRTTALRMAIARGIEALQEDIREP